MKTLFTALAGAMLVVLTASQATIAWHMFSKQGTEYTRCVENEGGWECYAHHKYEQENIEKAFELQELYKQYPASRKKAEKRI